MGANMVNYDISPLRVVSQEVIADDYVLSADVLNRILRHADSTFIVT
jgi:ribosomal protein S25